MDINGGNYPNSNGSPIFPGTQFTGPLLAGNVFNSDTTAWTGSSKTCGIGTTASATALTAAGALDGSALGQLSGSAGTDATRIGNWDNVGNTDVKIAVTSTNTGSGVGTLTVLYVQGINNAS